MHRVSKRDVGRLLELLDHRHAILVRQADRAVVEAQFGQAHADGVGTDADTMQRRHGVGRGVAHARLVVEHHHAVAHTGRGAGVADQAVERERALGDHRRESLEDPEVGALQLAGLAARCGSTTPAYSTAIGLPPQRTGMASIRAGSGSKSTAISPSEISPVSNADDEQRPLVVGRYADVVGEVDRLAGRRAHLGDDQPLGIVRRARTAAGRRNTGRRAGPTR